MICFGCSKEPSHSDGSFEYPQRMFWLRIFFITHTYQAAFFVKGLCNKKLSATKLHCDCDVGSIITGSWQGSHRLEKYLLEYGGIS